MRIKEIIVKNLTSYDDLHLKIDGNISYFIGENSAGKTNILKMLNAFFNNEQTDIITNLNLLSEEKNKKSYMVLNLEFNIDELKHLFISNQRYGIIALFSVLLQDYYIEVEKNKKSAKELTDKFNVLLIKDFSPKPEEYDIELAFPSNKTGTEYTSFRKHTAGFSSIFGHKSDIANIDALLKFYIKVFQEYRDKDFNINNFKSYIGDILKKDIENAEKGNDIDNFLFLNIPMLNKSKGVNNSPYDTITKNNNKIFYYYIHSETTPEKFLYNIKNMIFQDGQETNIIGRIKEILQEDIINILKESKYFKTCYSMEGIADENNDLFIRILNDLFSGVILKKDGNNILTLGSGERKSIIIDILKQVLKDKSQEYGLIILGFDEPETALNEKKKNEVFNAIKEILKTSNTQVFVTTHYYSPLSDEKLGHVFLVKKENNFSKMYRADIDRKDYISILRDSIGYGQFDVIKNSLSQHWLLLEGETDYNYIDTMMSFFDKDYWIGFKNKVNITWCGGAERVISVFISTILLSPKERTSKLFALFDNDIKINKSSENTDTYLKDYAKQLEGFKEKFNISGGNFFINFININKSNSFCFIDALSDTQINCIEDVLIPELYIEALEKVLKDEKLIIENRNTKEYKEKLLESRNTQYKIGIFEDFYEHYKECLNIGKGNMHEEKRKFINDILKSSDIKAKTSIEYTDKFEKLTTADKKKYFNYYNMWKKYFDDIMGKI